MVKMTMSERKPLIWRYFMNYWNNRRICFSIGGLSPAEKSRRYYEQMADAASTCMGYGCLLDFAALSQLIRHVRLVSDFCPSSYDFAIPSFRLYLTI